MVDLMLENDEPEGWVESPTGRAKNEDFNTMQLSAELRVPETVRGSKENRVFPAARCVGRWGE